MRRLAGPQPFASEAGDPKARAAGVLTRQVAGVGHGLPLAVAARRLHGEEARPVRRGDGRAAQFAIAAGFGGDVGVLAGREEVQVHQPHRPLGPAGGKPGEFPGDGRAALAAIGADELDHPPTARPWWSEGGPQLRHLGRQVHHHPNRRTRRIARLNQALPLRNAWGRLRLRACSPPMQAPAGPGSATPRRRSGNPCA